MHLLCYNKMVNGAIANNVFWIYGVIANNTIWINGVIANNARNALALHICGERYGLFKN